MSKEVLNKLIEQSLTDKKLNAQMQSASREFEQAKKDIAARALSEYDLSTDEREALLSKDRTALAALGVSANLLRRAEWCTGE